MLNRKSHRIAERYWSRSLHTVSSAVKQIDDISIRETRSANNNVKRTYEIAPSYRWTISPRLSLNQTFRMYIQYQDYDFIGFEGVNKEDGFNKRGNLNTTVDLSNGAVATYAVTAPILSHASGTIGNTAMVTAVNETDPVGGNDSATDDDTVPAEVMVRIRSSAADISA